MLYLDAVEVVWIVIQIVVEKIMFCQRVSIVKLNVAKEQFENVWIAMVAL